MRDNAWAIRFLKKFEGKCRKLNNQLCYSAVTDEDFEKIMNVKKLLEIENIKVSTKSGFKGEKVRVIV